MSARKKIMERLLRIVGECERGQGISERELKRRATLTGNTKIVGSVLRDLLEEEKLVRLTDGTIGFPSLPEGHAWAEDLIEAWRQNEKRGDGQTSS